MRKNVIVAVGTWILVVLIGTCAWAEVQPVALDNSDCVKCHLEQARDVDARGALHKTAVSCLDCHEEHGPWGQNVIPECSRCHDPGDQAHFGVENCIGCHYPHHPLEIDLASLDGVKPVCMSCHPSQGEELTTYPSMHAELDCNECHMQHGEWQECLECHDGHTEDMTYPDCLRCHRPHMPTVVAYANDVPSAFCGGCHDGVFDTLMANTSKHHDLLCAYCHQDKHKMVPKCTECHGEPHGAQLHAKFTDCLQCHEDPHGLIK